MQEIERVPDLRSQIYERLRRALRVGTYPPGSRLYENDVAKDLGVSRTPAREALALLTRDGILVHEGRSFTVPVYGAEQIAEVFEVRRRMEPYAVRVACERATAEELKSLRIAADAALKTGASAQKYVEANFSLRQTLFSLTRNRRLQEVIHLYEDLVHFVRLKTLDQEANRELSVKGWRKLVSAVLARKADVAEEAMERLLTIAEQAMIQALQQAAPASPDEIKPKL